MYQWVDSLEGKGKTNLNSFYLDFTQNRQRTEPNTKERFPHRQWQAIMESPAFFLHILTATRNSSVTAPAPRKRRTSGFQT